MGEKVRGIAHGQCRCTAKQRAYGRSPARPNRYLTELRLHRLRLPWLIPKEKMKKKI